MQTSCGNSSRWTAKSLRQSSLTDVFPSSRGRRLFVLTCFLVGAVNPAAAASVAFEWNKEALAAIRLTIPDPPAHARHLFHLAIACYDSWAAYDETAIGYLRGEKVAELPLLGPARESARRQAINYAAYLTLRARYGSGTDTAATLTRSRLDQRLLALGGSPSVALSAAVESSDLAVELGKHVAAEIAAWAAQDRFDQADHPVPYNGLVNPNWSVPLSVLGRNAIGQNNMPLGAGIPAATQPNFWQPLALATSITQNGLVIPGGIQPFLGVQSLATIPFALTRDDASKPWLDPLGGPSQLSLPGQPSATDGGYKQAALEVLRASSLLNSSSLIDISPGALGNNPLGSDGGTGHPLNPATGQPYAPHLVPQGDFVRVLAEYWADGPDSETPPGHWHSLANAAVAHPSFSRRLGGEGPELDELEWDVKMYFALGAAVHDAACAAWALKRYYSGPRPITMIRYLDVRGQSSDPDLPSYHVQGLLLEPGVCEVITTESSQPGQRHFLIWDVSINGYDLGASHLGKIAVFSWPGEHPSNPPPPQIATHQSTVRWMLARDWLPFQRKTFNTPAFPGYVSGHSTFSRAAAGVLHRLTGSAFFPGGLMTHTVPANSLQMDRGPSETVTLQWATFYDAADQAGQSRIWGGIHPSEDDHHGRVIGDLVANAVMELAARYWSGDVRPSEPELKLALSGSNLHLRWTAQRAQWQSLETSTDLQAWQAVMPPSRALNPREELWLPRDSSNKRKFFRVRLSPTALAPP